MPYACCGLQSPRLNTPPLQAHAVVDGGLSDLPLLLLGRMLPAGVCLAVEPDVSGAGAGRDQDPSGLGSWLMALQAAGTLTRIYHPPLAGQALPASVIFVCYKLQLMRSLSVGNDSSQYALLCPWRPASLSAPFGPTFPAPPLSPVAHLSLTTSTTASTRTTPQSIQSALNWPTTRASARCACTRPRRPALAAATTPRVSFEHLDPLHLWRCLLVLC